MRLDRDPLLAGPLIEGFASGGFRIEGSVQPALLLTPESAMPWEPPALTDLTEADLATLFESNPEFILLGTGATLVRPPLALRKAFEARRLGLEAMDSRAAARAWGILRGEGRRIAAALYPLDRAA